MIKPEELRIGNWLKSGSEYFQVANIEGHVLYGGEIKPIELTEEILIKAGFEEVMHFTVTRSLHKSIGRRGREVRRAVSNNRSWMA